VDGEAILSISHEVLIEHHAIIPPAIVEHQGFYRFVVERKIDCSAARGLILYLRLSIEGKIILTNSLNHSLNSAPPITIIAKVARDC